MACSTERSRSSRIRSIRTTISTSHRTPPPRSQLSTRRPRSTSSTSVSVAHTRSTIGNCFFTFHSIWRSDWRRTRNSRPPLSGSTDASTRRAPTTRPRRSATGSPNPSSSTPPRTTGASVSMRSSPTRTRFVTSSPPGPTTRSSRTLSRVIVRSPTSALSSCAFLMR